VLLTGPPPNGETRCTGADMESLEASKKAEVRKTFGSHGHYCLGEKEPRRGGKRRKEGEQAGRLSEERARHQADGGGRGCDGGPKLGVLGVTLLKGR